MKEHFGRLKGLKLVYVGDVRNNVVSSLMLGCAKAGVDFVNCTPEALMPEPEAVRASETIAAANGSYVKVINDPMAAVEGANVIYTDVWVSMGEEDKQDVRIALLKPYQVNMALMQATGKLEDDQVIFLHCLPAFHDHETCLLYTSPSPRDQRGSRMPSSA